MADTLLLTRLRTEIGVVVIFCGPQNSDFKESANIKQRRSH